MGISKEYELARALKQRLLKMVPILDFRLFGSRARGDHEEDSDIDLFLEVGSLTEDLERKIYDIAWEVG